MKVVGDKGDMLHDMAGALPKFVSCVLTLAPYAQLIFVATNILGEVVLLRITTFRKFENEKLTGSRSDARNLRRRAGSGREPKRKNSSGTLQIENPRARKFSIR